MKKVLQPAIEADVELVDDDKVHVGIGCESCTGEAKLMRRERIDDDTTIRCSACGHSFHVLPLVLEAEDDA